MKPAPFVLERPDTLEGAVALLAAHAPDAAVLAGGQSLLIELRYRTRSPRVVVDIGRLVGLETAQDDGRAVRLGALARHRVLEDLPALGTTDPLAAVAARAASHVAHPPIRTRGTVAGSLAWAHPCAEWGALALAAGARLTLESTRGRRVVDIADWYLAPFATARAADELVVGVDLPHLGAGASEGTVAAGRTGAAFVELRRTSASFALVAVVVALSVDDGGSVSRARIAVSGAGPVPLRAPAAEGSLLGRRPDPEALREASALARAAADPVDEPHTSADYRRHAVEVLVRRALEDAAASLPPGPDGAGRNGAGAA